MSNNLLFIRGTSGTVHALNLALVQSFQVQDVTFEVTMANGDRLAFDAFSLEEAKAAVSRANTM